MAFGCSKPKHLPVKFCSVNIDLFIATMIVLPSLIIVASFCVSLVLTSILSDGMLDNLKVKLKSGSRGYLVPRWIVHSPTVLGQHI